MPGPLYKDGHLGKVTWTEPSTEALLWMMAAIYAAPILVPLAIAAIYVAARCV